MNVLTHVGISYMLAPQIFLVEISQSNCHQVTPSKDPRVDESHLANYHWIHGAKESDAHLSWIPNGPKNVHKTSSAPPFHAWVERWLPRKKRWLRKTTMGSNGKKYRKFKRNFNQVHFMFSSCVDGMKSSNCNQLDDIRDTNISLIHNKGSKITKLVLLPRKEFTNLSDVILDPTKI